MSNVKTIAGDNKLTDIRIAIVASRFNSFIVDKLLDGALDTLNSHGIEEQDIEIIQVPGAFEIPLAAKTIARSKRFDAVIALGAVIRGETPHFDYVAGACTDGILNVSLQYDLPITFGVLTVDNVAQADARAGGNKGNKGADAAHAAIEMISLIKKFGSL